MRRYARFFEFYRKGMALLAVAALLICLLFGVFRLFRFYGSPSRLFEALFTREEEFEGKKHETPPVVVIEEEAPELV